MWSSVIFNTIGTVLHHLKIKLPTAYSTEAEASHQGHSHGTEHHPRIELPTAYSSEAEASDTSVASILHHDLLNCEEPVTVWSPSTKSSLN